MPRRGAVGITLLAATIAVSTGAVPAQPGTQLRFADGAYEGTLVYTGQIGAEGVSAFGGANGTFDLAVAGGTVGEGSFQLAGAGTSMVAGGGTAMLTAQLSGTIDGPSTQPVLRGQAAHFSGEATALGFTVPVDFSAGPGDMVPAPMNIESATCTQVVGDFVQQWSAFISGQGLSNDLYGRFVAVRTGEADQDALTTLAELIANTSEVADAAAGGAIDAERLIELVAQAESFSTSLQTNEACGLLDQPGDFNTAITGIIGDLLGVALANAGAFSTADLFLLLSIGVRVGAVGEGAIDAVKSDQILNGFEVVFSTRLEAAIQAGNTSEIESIYLAALSMGWKDLAEEARNAL